MSNLTKRDLVVRISNETGLVQKSVAVVVDEMIRHLVDSLAQGQAVEFRKFGVFQVKRRKARIGRNPQHPENSVPIPPRVVVKFKAGKEMKEQVAALTRHLANGTSPETGIAAIQK